jgi:hypothetical protein
MHSFDHFLKDIPRNVWVHEPGIRIYVRRSIRTGVDIDLANMEADEPGQGALTRFLAKYEPLCVFCVENIHNPRLHAYLKRRGYLQLAGFEGAVSMVSKNYWERKK